jgi:hypothetical protein
MSQEFIHFFSFFLCAGGFSLAVAGLILTFHAVTIPLIRHKFQAAYPFLLMILGGLLAAFFGWKGIISFPTPKRLEIKAPPDSVIRAEVIRNGQVIHKEEI